MAKKKTTKVKKAVKSKKPKIVKVAPKILKNRIAIVLDSSSSMLDMASEVVQGFNSQIDALIKNNGNMDTKISLLTFSGEVNPFTYNNVNLNEVQKLTPDQYKPLGWTALYDAMGKAIETMQVLPEANDPDCSFLLFVVTDGQENASKQYNFSKISEKIKELETTKRWTITYLGAENGLQDVGSSLGIAKGNTISGQALRASGVYTSYATNAMTNYTRARASGASASLDMFVPENKETKEGKK